jgi:Dolichyl-phosphate-mannose-protein mannosyltransferase
MPPDAQHQPSLPDGRRRETLASLALSVLGGTLSAWTVLDRGWVPHDEGTLALAAERVLHGDVPHIAFLDPYTGGLSYWHALAMRAFGMSLMAPRYGLFVAFVLWLPAIWWLAARSCGHRWAVVITILAAWWSLPIYPAAMPSWYLLFLGTWTIVALERWHSSKHTRWLVVIGLLCGIAVSVKQTGLYIVAGALLGLLFCEQEATRQRWPEGRPAGRTDPMVVLLLASLGALVLTLTWGFLHSGELLHLVAPVTSLLVLAALRERHLTDDGARRWRFLLRSVGIMALAAAVPLLLLLLPYLRHGGLGALYAGSVGAGIERISSLHRGMPPVHVLLRAAWPVYLVLLVEVFAGPRRALRIIPLLCGVALLVLAGQSGVGYRRLWFFSTSVLPLASAAVVVAGLRAWRGQYAIDPILLALAGITALQALNQFPFSAPVYFAFVAPLAIVTASAAAAHFGALRRLRTGFMLLAGLAVLARVGSVFSLGVYPIWWDYEHRLAVPRGGLLVSKEDSVGYARMLQLVASHRSNGTVAAGPELPEVYFLSGSRSPGPDSYSLFSGDVRDSTQAARMFNATSASVVVIQNFPMSSQPLREDVYHWLAIRYPDGESVGTIEVRWRAPH